MRVQKNSEYDLMAAVAIAGPVTIGIDHLHSSFQVMMILCLFYILSFHLYSFTAAGFLTSLLALTPNLLTLC